MNKVSFLVAAFVAVVVAANVVTDNFGLVGVAGLLVPAGSVAAGLAFSLRDMLQDASRTLVPLVVALTLGTVASVVFASPAIALASGVAFLVSEALDFAVYTPLRKKGWMRAVVVSNIVGAVADTFLFLTLAGFPLSPSVVLGQFAAKLILGTGLVLAVRSFARKRSPVVA